MKITWQIEDGYVGKSRPQHLEIPDDELEDLTADEKEEYINNYVQDDFEQRISWVITSRSDEK